VARNTASPMTITRRLESLRAAMTGKAAAAD
jgi:hypothetical protein